TVQLSKENQLKKVNRKEELSQW
ncbi:molybdenum cofactor guanylyltransferase, partial [Enterococcus faecalis]